MFKSIYQRHQMVILWTLTIVLIIRFFIFSIENYNRDSGFVAYYTATKLLFAGHSPAEFYDKYWFQNQINNYTDEIKDIYNANMPTMSYIAFPFHLFDYNLAKNLWFIWHLILMFFAVYLLHRKYKFTTSQILIFSSGLILFQPFRSNLVVGQVYIYILLLIIALWYGLTFQRTFLAGFAIALMFMLKSVGIFFFFYFLIRKQWKLLAMCFISILLIFLISLPRIGIDSWLAYLNELSRFSNDVSLLSTANQNLHGFIHHFFTYHPIFSPDPLINSPLSATIFHYILTIGILIVVYINTNKDKFRPIDFFMIILLNILLSPVTIHYHFVYLIIPIVGYWISYYPHANWKIKMFFVLSVSLIALSIPYSNDWLSSGYNSLFAYSRFYASGILFYIFLKTMKQENKGDYVQ